MNGLDSSIVLSNLRPFLIISGYDGLQSLIGSTWDEAFHGFCLCYSRLQQLFIDASIWDLNSMEQAFPISTSI